MPQTPPSAQPDTVSRYVLIGEDDLDDQELFREVFSSIDVNLEFVFLSNGTAVVSFMDDCDEKHLPCLIVLDYNMPGLNGADILERLKNNSCFEKIPKIIWSTSGSDVFKNRCLDLGASAYIIKPSNVKDLKDIAAHMLSFC